VLFVLTEGGRLLVQTVDEQHTLRPGRTVISLVDADQDASRAT
jgi:hypothetical protein